ncbi:hypothetical protein E2C01_048655 [Portunus trituberculatus]|uniref:Uncharacterized protein n=1 Tax=Portunus trituberculatus TaxID=210409 RepID=A0A5B7G3N3_PORTR|nr:hypothetical protein [Portunus trituberculatus]
MPSCFDTVCNTVSKAPAISRAMTSEGRPATREKYQDCDRRRSRSEVERLLEPELSRRLKVVLVQEPRYLLSDDPFECFTDHGEERGMGRSPLGFVRAGKRSLEGSLFSTCVVRGAAVGRRGGGEGADVVVRLATGTPSGRNLQHPSQRGPRARWSSSRAGVWIQV